MKKFNGRKKKALWAPFDILSLQVAQHLCQILGFGRRLDIVISFVCNFVCRDIFAVFCDTIVFLIKACPSDERRLLPASQNVTNSEMKLRCFVALAHLLVKLVKIKLDCFVSGQSRYFERQVCLTLNLM